MGDTLYPIDNVRPIRARDFIQRCRTLDELAQLQGVPAGALAHVQGEGLYRATVTPDAALLRAGSDARSPRDYYRIQAANVGRYRAASTVFESRGRDNNAGFAVAVESGILLEPARTNRVDQQPSAGFAYNTGTASGTRTAFTDDQLGGCMRLTRTAGASLDRWGIYGGGGSLAGPSYVTMALVRALNAVGNLVLYTDAQRAGGGLITGSAALALAVLPLGEWAILRFRSRVGGATLAGSFSTFFWLDGASLGGACDVALITTTSGPGYLQGLEAPITALASANADEVTLAPLVPLSGLSGMVAVRHDKATTTRDQPTGEGYTPRVLWQARIGPDGLRLAVEADQTLALTITSGGTTTTVAVAWTAIAAGAHTFAARWSQAQGVAQLWMDGALLAQATGLGSGAFPAVSVASILLGHSGSGAESLQGVVGWLAHRQWDPGADTTAAQSAAAAPQAPYTSLWDFRDGAGLASLPAEARPMVVRSAVESCAWIKDVAAERGVAAARLFDYLAW